MKGKKKILLAVVLVLVMAVGITSIVVIRNRNKTVVKVFPVSMLNSSDWFDTDTSLTGTLTSDYIQEVHIDGGQKVKKVYVKKGDKLYIEGKIRTRSYEDNNGVKRYVTEVYGYNMEMLSPKKDGQTTQRGGAPTPPPPIPDQDEDDLPF